MGILDEEITPELLEAERERAAQRRAEKKKRLDARKARAAKGIRLEEDIQEDILRWLRAHGLLVARLDASAQLNARGYRELTDHTGWPDIIGMLPDGKFLGIEVKSKTGSLRDSQVRFFDAVNAVAGANHVCFVARSVEDVIAVFTARGYL